MELRTSVALVVYLASYLPLSVILLIQDIETNANVSRLCFYWRHVPRKCLISLQHPYFALSAVGVCIVCFSVALLTMRLIKPKQEVMIEEVNHVPADLMNYILPYVVSFMSLDYVDASKFFGFLVFFAWIFLITHKSGRIIMNPVLIVLGWRFFEISYSYAGGSDRKYKKVVLSRVDLEPMEKYRHSLIQDVMIIKAREVPHA